MVKTLVTVDAGSSSVRLAAFKVDPPEAFSSSDLATADATQFATAHSEIVSGTGSAVMAAILRAFVEKNSVRDVVAVAHRIVHGGSRFTSSSLISGETEQQLEALSDLAPLHMPVALEWIRLARAAFGTAAQIAVFDTTFFSSLPEVAQRYAIPREIERKYGARRFGFHGLAHQFMLQRVAMLRPDLDRGGRLISLQLGAGCSIAAIGRGEPVDTSMGFSPLEGLVMATRSGDVDPGLLTFLQRSAGFSADSLEAMLNHESGLLGVSGLSGDMRQLLVAKDAEAKRAIDLYCYRIRKYIGAYMTVLGGVDVIAFGGGVGENSPQVRRLALAGMEWCGISVDHAKNESLHSADARDSHIGKPDYPVDIRVIAVDEAMVLAHEALQVLRAVA